MTCLTGSAFLTTDYSLSNRDSVDGEYLKTKSYFS